jgi:hypothetical protein
LESEEEGKEKKGEKTKQLKLAVADALPSISIRM